MTHVVAYECTFLTMHNNEIKSKQIQRNVGKIDVPELNLHPVQYLSQVQCSKKLKVRRFEDKTRQNSEPIHQA